MESERHPYDVGDKVWIILDSRRERATVTGIGWEHGRPEILVKLDEDAAIEKKASRSFAGVYKFPGWGRRVEPVSAIELLAEVVDA